MRISIQVCVRRCEAHVERVRKNLILIVCRGSCGFLFVGVVTALAYNDKLAIIAGNLWIMLQIICSLKIITSR